MGLHPLLSGVRREWTDAASRCHPRPLSRPGSKETDLVDDPATHRRPAGCPPAGPDAAFRFRTCFQPPRGALHHHRPEGRRQRLLHVPQLRGRPLRLRHADRQLPAAAGCLRRPELLRARSERALRDPHRQQRGREGGPELPVPLPQHPVQRRCRHQPEDRRPLGGHSAGPVRPGLAGGRPEPAAGRDLHRPGGARRPPHRHPPGADPGRHRQRDLCQAGRQHRRQDDSRLSRLRRQACACGRDSGLRDAGTDVCRPAPGSVCGQSRPGLRPGQRAGVGHHRSGADRCGAQPARCEERHRDRAGDPPQLPDQRRRRDRRLDQRQPAPGPADRRQARQRASGQRARRRRLDAGVAPGHAPGQRGGHRAEGQGPLQRLQALGRCAVRRLCDPSDAAGAAGDRAEPAEDRADQPAAHRSGHHLPDRHQGREPAEERRRLGDAAAEHRHRAGGLRRAEPARHRRQPAGRRQRQRRLSEWPPAQGRCGRHLAGGGDGRAVPGQWRHRQARLRLGLPSGGGAAGRDGAEAA